MSRCLREIGVFSFRFEITGQINDIINRNHSNDDLDRLKAECKMSFINRSQMPRHSSREGYIGIVVEVPVYYSGNPQEPLVFKSADGKAIDPVEFWEKAHKAGLKIKGYEWSVSIPQPGYLAVGPRRKEFARLARKTCIVHGWVEYYPEKQEYTVTVSEPSHFRQFDKDLLKDMTSMVWSILTGGDARDLNPIGVYPQLRNPE